MTSTTTTDKKQSSSSLYWRYALAGGTCAMATHVILVPMDVIKTRLQVSTEYKGVFDAFKRMPKQEGLRSLFLGMGPTFVGYYLQGGCKFGAFEYFKNKAVEHLGVEYVSQHRFPIYIASSTAAETLATVLLCPWEALRIRQVSSPELYAYNQGTLQSLYKIYAQEGFNGFYKGILPILAKQIPYTATQLTVFSECIQLFYSTLLPKYLDMQKEDLSTGKQLATSVGCGIVAGVASSIASHPADTILSRINMKVESGQPKRTILNVTKELGFKGIWLGVGTRAAMVSMLSAGMFLIYDSVKLAVGLPTSEALKKESTNVDQKSNLAAVKE